MIREIKKYLVYSVREKDFYDYQILINDIHLTTNSSIDSKYAGLFICTDEHKNLRIFNNFTKEYIDIE